MSGTFQLSVVTPEGAVLETEATSAVFPAFDGQYGILHNHAPLVTLLGIGELRVDRADGGEEHYYVDGGFAQFAENKLSLLTEQARPLSEVEAAEADRLLEEARAMPAPDGDAAALRETHYQRAWVQKRLAAKSN